MGKASRRKRERRQSEAPVDRRLERFAAEHEHLSMTELWFRAGSPDVDPTWQAYACAVVARWLNTSQELLPSVVRAAQPVWLGTFDDFLDFTTWAVQNGRLTAEDGLVTSPESVDAFLAEPDNMMQTLAVFDRLDTETR